MGKRITAILAALVGLAGCSAQRFTTLSPGDFQLSVADGSVQLVDVRTPDEFAEQHIPGAVNIDVYEDDFIDQCMARLDKDRPVAVYCRSGKRSANAAGQLRKAGFKPVLNLDGGIMAWLDAAKPVTR